MTEKGYPPGAGADEMNAAMTDWLLRPRISAGQIDDLSARAIEAIHAHTSGMRAAVAWSGGKDGLAVYSLAAQCGITQGVIGLCGLELPSFLRFVEAYRPPSISIQTTGQDAAWARRNPHMIFPERRTLIKRWASVKQLASQERYCREREIEVLINGRRTADGNFVRRNGLHTKRCVKIYSPIGHWSHEETLALLHYRGIALPRSYFRPRGFLIGSKQWPLYRESQLGMSPAEYLLKYEPLLAPVLSEIGVQA